MKPILCIDFDGVIHAYSRGWQDGNIYDAAVPGFFDWAVEAKNHFRLVIYSSRSKTPEGVQAMKDWIGDRLLEWDSHTRSDDPPLWPGDFEFAHEKPPAFLTIDDRAMQFRGDWTVWWLKPDTLLDFKPWTVGPQHECYPVETFHAEAEKLTSAIMYAGASFGRIRTVLLESGWKPAS